MSLSGLSDNLAIRIFSIQDLSFNKRPNACRFKAFLYFVLQQLNFLTALRAHIIFYNLELTSQSSNLPEKENDKHTPS